MYNETCQWKSRRVLKSLVEEAKVRLVDAKTRLERREWRAAIRSLEILIQRRVQLPQRGGQLSGHRHRSATQC